LLEFPEAATDGDEAGSAETADDPEPENETKDDSDTGAADEESE